MATETATKWVYEFSEGSRDMRDLLGGKGANVAEMTRVLGAERVPAGFTITTEACGAFLRDGRRRGGAEGGGGGGGCPRGSRRGWTRRSRGSSATRGARSAIRRTRCSSRCARARASPCRGCS